MLCAFVNTVGAGWVVVISAPLGCAAPSRQADDQVDHPTPQTTDPGPVNWLRREEGLAARWLHALSQGHEVGDGGGCVAQHYRPIGRGHRPHGAQEDSHRSPWCTTGDQSAHVSPRGEAARRMSAPESAGSSAEAVPTLGPTGLQDGAPGPGAHTCAKAVLSGFSAIIGLKCALHGRLLVRGPRADPLANMGVPAPAARDELSTG